MRQHPWAFALVLGSKYNCICEWFDPHTCQLHTHDHDCMWECGRDICLLITLTISSSDCIRNYRPTTENDIPLSIRRFFSLHLIHFIGLKKQGGNLYLFHFAAGREKSNFDNKCLVKFGKLERFIML